MVIETQVGEQEADLAMLFEAIYRVTTMGGVEHDHERSYPVFCSGGGVE
jgi:hypothetical protein